MRAQPAATHARSHAATQTKKPAGLLSFVFTFIRPVDQKRAFFLRFLHPFPLCGLCRTFHPKQMSTAVKFRQALVGIPRNFSYFGNFFPIFVSWSRSRLINEAFSPRTSRTPLVSALWLQVVAPRLTCRLQSSTKLTIFGTAARVPFQARFTSHKPGLSSLTGIRTSGTRLSKGRAD